MREGGHALREGAAAQRARERGQEGHVVDSGADHVVAPRRRALRPLHVLPLREDERRVVVLQPLGVRHRRRAGRRGERDAVSFTAAPSFDPPPPWRKTTAPVAFDGRYTSIAWGKAFEPEPSLTLFNTATVGAPPLLDEELLDEELLDKHPRRGRGRGRGRGRAARREREEQEGRGRDGGTRMVHGNRPAFTPRGSAVGCVIGCSRRVSSSVERHPPRG